MNAYTLDRYELSIFGPPCPVCSRLMIWGTRSNSGYGKRRRRPDWACLIVHELPPRIPQSAEGTTALRREAQRTGGGVEDAPPLKRRKV